MPSGNPFRTKEIWGRGPDVQGAGFKPAEGHRLAMVSTILLNAALDI
jgi:hypothetical protein